MDTTVDEIRLGRAVLADVKKNIVKRQVMFKGKGYDEVNWIKDLAWVFSDYSSFLNYCEMGKIDPDKYRDMIKGLCPNI